MNTYRAIGCICLSGSIQLDSTDGVDLPMRSETGDDRAAQRLAELGLQLWQK